MTQTVPGILARIVEHKRKERVSSAVPRAELERRALVHSSTRRDFRAALEQRTPAIIAEIKKASPSKGVLTGNFDPARLAREYERGGAAALSVLTDAQFFQGSLADLKQARDASGIPVLRKDFTMDEYHVIEAAAHGADAILLIAAILPAAQIRSLRERAHELGMAALVEVHNEQELDSALDAGAAIIGVNNRDLNSFEVTLETSLRLSERIPADIVKVSESGIHSAHDIRMLQSAGFQAFLVGEHLMRSGDPAAALRYLMEAA